ncbi:hypothetical protein B0H19DRAFT_44603 [Mycena capillaripes]|nr:hypothetical protein B0H19DRAFT_44603 [Mycena capillaripes]
MNHIMRANRAWAVTYGTFSIADPGARGKNTDTFSSASIGHRVMSTFLATRLQTKQPSVRQGRAALEGLWGLEEATLLEVGVGANACSIVTDGDDLRAMPGSRTLTGRFQISEAYQTSEVLSGYSCPECKVNGCRKPHSVVRISSFGGFYCLFLMGTSAVIYPSFLPSFLPATQTLLLTIPTALETCPTCSTPTPHHQSPVAHLPELRPT